MASLPESHHPLRASDDDRELAVDVLRVAAGDGRLTMAELDERLEAALSARTIGELAALTADLPGGIVLHATVRAQPSRWALLQSLLSEPLLTEPWRHRPLPG